MSVAGLFQERLRDAALPVYRVLLIVLAVYCLHTQHGRWLRWQEAGRSPFTVEQAQRFFATAARTSPSDTLEGAWNVYDGEDKLLGSLLQTSPQADDIRGFSGPTNVLLVCDAEQIVRQVEILSSRDTRDHVELVRRDPTFLAQFQGKSLGELARPQPRFVTGATLTSYAILEAVAKRMGATGVSLKFKEEITLADVRTLFPAATRFAIDPVTPAVVRVRTEEDVPIGWLLRTSPAADNVVGYQGPTDVLIGFGSDGRVFSLAVRKSYDNEPYVGYVRDDAYFREIFNGQTLAELGQYDLKSAGVEGVSGATMTSMAVAKGVIVAASEHAKKEAARATTQRWWQQVSWGPILIAMFGVGLAFSRWRGSERVRLAWQMLLVVYLGFISGELLSQALWIGWAKEGIAWQATSFLVLSAVALLLPLGTGRNVYCQQICPHGAAQQLLLRYAKPKLSLGARGQRAWRAIPLALLLACFGVGLSHAPISLADLEPFDAYSIRAASWISIALAVGSLVVASLVPMAYCRYGCPTGALIDYVRWHRGANRFTWTDIVVTIGVVVGLVIVMNPR